MVTSLADGRVCHGCGMTVSGAGSFCGGCGAHVQPRAQDASELRPASLGDTPPCAHTRASRDAQPPQQQPQPAHPGWFDPQARYERHPISPALLATIGVLIVVLSAWVGAAIILAVTDGDSGRSSSSGQATITVSTHAQ